MYQFAVGKSNTCNLIFLIPICFLVPSNSKPLSAYCDHEITEENYKNFINVLVNPKYDVNTINNPHILNSNIVGLKYLLLTNFSISSIDAI